jgi:hypothetical protein
MAGIDSTWGSTHLQRSEIFAAQMKDLLRDELIASQFVRTLTDIPSDSIATELKINSIGSLSVSDWKESVSMPAQRMDTGQFKFRISEFIGNKVEFTDHFFETSFQANEVLAATPVEMKRALDEYRETKIFELANDQTNNTANLINGAKHRFVGGGDGTALPLNALTLEDFSYARYVLQKANVPMSGLVCVVGPEQEHIINTLTNIVNVSNNPMWEGIVTTGMGDMTGTRFLKNIYGFDIYVSNRLSTTATDEAALTTYNDTAVASTAGYQSNMFFSMASDMSKPFIGATGRPLRMKSWRDEDIETEYHYATESFGFGLYRPESLVVTLTNPAAY